MIYKLSEKAKYKVTTNSSHIRHDSCWDNGYGLS